MKYHKTIEAFAKQMTFALEKAGPRPGKVENAERNGWIDDTPGELYMLLSGYRVRLEHALAVGHLTEAQRQCVNVANAAMMLAEVLERAGAEPSIDPLDAIKGYDMGAEQAS